MEYSLTRDIGRVSKNYSVAMYNSVHSQREILESGFPVQFTCNSDGRVYSNAYFLKQLVRLTEPGGRLTGVQVYYNIDLTDVARITRDFSRITEKDIGKIVTDLMPLCVEEIESGRVNSSGLLFNVDLELS